MTDRLILLVKMLIALLPFVVLCYFNKKLNLHKSERSKQFAMPVVAALYVVAVMAFADPINDWLIKICNKMPQWIEGLGGFSWMPAQVSSFFTQMGAELKAIIKGLNLNFWIYFISNAVIMLTYLVIKSVILGILRKSVKKDNALHSKVSGSFYDYYAEKDAWCIKNSFVQVRSLFKTFYYASVILSVVLMLITREFYNDSAIESVFYPVFGILIIGELYFYLDGLTKKEYREEIYGEDENSYKVTNYTLLKRYLRSAFGDKLIAENTEFNYELDSGMTVDEVIGNLEKCDNPKITVFAEFAKHLNQTGFKIDKNYLRSSVYMLCGNSILFNNPFYEDLIPYAFYPANRTLLRHKKVLVILGRHSIEDDIKSWLEKGIASVTNIPFLWNIGVLGNDSKDVDIGIMTRSQVFDIKLHAANSEFLKKVGFVFIIEPSKLISTAQIGLNMLVKSFGWDKDVVYCISEKNCDGLVDAMSHILMTSITEVAATERHKGTSSYMCWAADGEYIHHRIVPNISRYLGLGTELSFAALKNQVSKSKWLGGEAFPVVDMNWIDRQYYYDLTRYASLPAYQESIDEHFMTSANLWNAEVEKNAYLIVEDEAFNMFEVLRDFSTRTTEQGFVNVISSDYLLRDYMAANASIFEADPKAIPMIVADYTRSNRNTVLKIVLMMSTLPISDETLSSELSLLGIRTFDAKKQLWYELFSYYSSVDALSGLSDDYQTAVDEVYQQSITIKDKEWSNDIILVGEELNYKTGKMERVYSITEPYFLSLCVSELKSAGYITEDEEGAKYYLGSELSGQVYQRCLPGQFFTLGGKYYEMQYITANGDVLVRRASDHITERPMYRQIRNYTLHAVRDSDRIGSQVNIAGLKVSKLFADITVSTDGYYKMQQYNDFETAQRISFDGNGNGIPERNYLNKEVLCIELPDFDGKLNNNVRYTIAVLLNEVFRTIFAENQSFICAVTDDGFLSDFNEVKPLTYSVCGEGYELGANSIYIIEDSQLDLGLIVAVERNLNRIFEIVFDYLDWHMEALEESLTPQPEPQPHIVFDNVAQSTSAEDNKGAKGFLGTIKEKILKVARKIKAWFKKETPEANSGDGAATGDEPEIRDNSDNSNDDSYVKSDAQSMDIPETESNCEETGDGEAATDFANDETGATDDIDAVANDDSDVESETNEDDFIDKNSESEANYGSDITTVESSRTVNMPLEEEMQEVEITCKIAERKPYHERHYMLYGRESELEFIDLAGVYEYLSEMQLENNSLKQARTGKEKAEALAAALDVESGESRCCDFCGCKISGVEYETLSDGRERCMNCGRTAIKTVEEFRKLFENVKKNMESLFGISINVAVRVEMVNSKTLHRRLGKTFVPTSKSDARILGVAIKDKSGYSLLLESGSPRMSTIMTIVHELTHIWQYINWDEKTIAQKYGKGILIEVYEGMAKWVEVQYAYLINESTVAKREEISLMLRDDEYGHGYLRYRANYPLSLGTYITKPAPFMSVETPLESEFCGAVSVDINSIIPIAPMLSDERKRPKKAHKGSTGEAERFDAGAKERNPGNCRKYAFELLGVDEKKLYSSILDAVYSFTGEIRDIELQLNKDQVAKVLDYVLRDHPELFWFQGGASLQYTLDNEIVNCIGLTYCMTPQEKERRYKLIEKAEKSFVTSITDSMSDFEVALRVYENIIDLVDYDTVGLENQDTSSHDASVPDDLRSIYGVFVNRRAVCAGYAKATQYLLNKLGIECTYVVSDTHAWNLINLEGEYYYLDTTWGDRSNTKRTSENSRRIGYNYFCITTEELERIDEHTPTGDLTLPLCTANGCNYFVRMGLYFDKYDFERVREIICKSIRAGKKSIAVKFASDEVYNIACSQLIEAGRFQEILQGSNLEPSMHIGTNYQYCRDDNMRTIEFVLSQI